MKLSTKLLTGLLGILLVTMLVSAFSVKTEFDKINQKDLYWDFDKLSNKPFKHLKVIGQKDATGKVNIIEDKNFAVNVSKKWAEEVKISFENDTLIIRFFKNLSKSNKKVFTQNYIRPENFVTILCPEISSVKGEMTTINIDSLNQDKLLIEANKITAININHMKIPSLTIQLDKFSDCEFDNRRTYNFKNLEANVASRAVLKMRGVYPKNFILNTNEMSIVEMNGTALKAVKNTSN